MTAWFYIIVGLVLMGYPATLMYRVWAWETKQRREGKSLINAFIILPIAMAGYFLGIGMFLLGTEALKGNLSFTL